MQNYSIMPLDVTCVEEICQDIKYQYENGIATCALFSMTLTPEGSPAIDKAAIMCEKYDLFRKRLGEMGIGCGVLVQASIGHGYKLNQDFSFQKYTSVKTGEEIYVSCPYDEGFREYIKNALKTIASHKPMVIMIDDDFRLMARDGKGCACPVHLKRLSQLCGEEITREKLWEATCNTDKKSLEITRLFVETQRESLIGGAKAMREGIDEVDPSIPGVFCCCGEGAEFASEIAEILAGEGNPVTVRINNGNYTPEGARGQSKVAFRAAVQKIHMGEKVDTILAETDTCPQNRYSTSASSLHTHFVVSILEGAAGAKHWITRLLTYEPESGKKYREILSKYSGFYETLSSLVPKLSWIGCNNLLSEKPSYGFENEFDKSCYFAECVLERMGIPTFFSSEISETVFLDGEDIKNFSDEECRKILSGNTVLSGISAKILEERGFGDYLGVGIREWKGKNVSFERYLANGKKIKTQNEIKEIVPKSDEVQINSMCFHLKDGREEIPLFPGCTIFKNKLGGSVIVFAGTPKAEFHYTSAFSFLTQTRKEQITSILKEISSLPVYMVGDDEVYMKAAKTDDGAYFVSVINTGFDEMEEIKLYVNKEINKVLKLCENGEWKECDKEYCGDIITIKTDAKTLKPVILKMF